MARKTPAGSDKVDMHFIKSNYFRVIHADGAWGGTTPAGNIGMTFYSERSPIPTRLVHKITPDGKLGGELSRTVRKGIVREAEVQVVLSVGVAKALISWLENKIQNVEEVHTANMETIGDKVQ